MYKYRPTKKASINEVENFLTELDKLAEYLPDDAIQSDVRSLIEDICKDREICDCCYTHIEESWTNDGLIRECNCKRKRISA